MRIISVAKNILLFQWSLMLATNEKWCFEHLLSWTTALNVECAHWCKFSTQTNELQINTKPNYDLCFQSSVVTFNTQLLCEVMTLADGSR